MSINSRWMDFRQYVQLAKRLWRVTNGTDLWSRRETSCHCEFLGSSYGGWRVALERIHKDAVVYSFGIGDDISFDEALIERCGVEVHGFDPSPRSRSWAAEQRLPPQFTMHEVGLAGVDGSLTIYPPEQDKHVSYTLIKGSTELKGISVPVKRLSTIMKELGHDSVDLLKMDIEGAEYEVLEDLARSEIRPRQLLVEFHHRFPGVGVDKTRSALATLKRLGYQIFAVSANGEEYSFLHDACRS